MTDLLVGLDEVALLVGLTPAKPLYGGFPRITRIGFFCFTSAAASRSISSSGKSRCCLGSVGGSQPVRALVRIDAGALLAVLGEGRAEAVERQADLQVADDKRRRQDLKAEDAAHGRLLQVVGDERVAALVAQRLGDLVEHLDQVGAGAAAGVEHHDARVGQAVGDVEL